jgi:dolichol-phosphate mannosyltransferase
MQGSLVLVPTYNERENLPRVLPRLRALGEFLDVLVIDDASPDGTGDIAEDFARSYPRLSVLHRVSKEGLGPAYVQGFKEALRRGCAAVVTMDADLSHAPEDIPRLLSALREADVAVGSRHAPGGGVDGWPRSRRLLSSLGGLYARTVLRLPVRDATGGFRAYRAEALSEIELGALSSKGFVFQVEVLRRILDLPGARALEVPILFRDRTFGTSKLTRRIVTEAVWEVLRLAFRRRKMPTRRRAAVLSAPSEAPQVSVVIPRRPEDLKPRALEGLSGLRYPPTKLELIVASGRSPSRQRNEAVKRSSGDLILFLDDDSVVSPCLLERYRDAFADDPTLGATGGPAANLPGNRFQEISSAVLSEPWVLGKSASRYGAFGCARYTDERELILCNLCVRRKAFEDLGGFDEALYPNEENEFLERLARRGWRSLYDPEASVKRPYRENLRSLVSAIFGYGRGRAAQARRLPSAVCKARLSLVLVALLGFLLCALGPFLGAPLLAIPAALYAVYIAALGMKLLHRRGIGAGLLGPLLALTVHGAYFAGLLWGLLVKERPRPAGEVQVEVLKCASPVFHRRVA